MTNDSVTALQITVIFSCEISVHVRIKMFTFDSQINHISQFTYVRSGDPRALSAGTFQILLIQSAQQITIRVLQISETFYPNEKLAFLMRPTVHRSFLFPNR